MTSRRYKLGKRAQTAAANRAKVIASARTLFGSVGFQGVTMNAVARHAGVGRTTVFEQFRSKTALFLAVADEMREQAFARQFVACAMDGVEARLQAALHGASELWSAELPLFHRLDGMAQLEPTSSQGADADVERRRAKAALLARDLVAAGRVRDGVRETQVADAIGLLSSFAAFSVMQQAHLDASGTRPIFERALAGFLLPAATP